MNGWSAKNSTPEWDRLVELKIAVIKMTNLGFIIYGTRKNWPNRGQ